MSRSKSRSLSHRRQRTRSRSRSPNSAQRQAAPTNSVIADSNPEKSKKQTKENTEGEGKIGLDNGSSTINKSGENTTEETALSEEVLQMIEKRLYEERTLKKPLYSQFADLWEKIIQKGLPDEEKKKLLKKYETPKNCLFTDPPKINPEIKSVIKKQSSGSVSLTRDARIVLKQETLNACLAAVSKIVTTIIEEKRDKENIASMDCSNDLIMLLANMNRDESMIRRSLIMSILSLSLKRILTDTQCQDQLFGKNLDELMKANKTLENSTKFFEGAAKTTTNKSKNFNGPHPKKNRTSGDRGQHQSYKRAQNGSLSYPRRKSSQQSRYNKRR